MFFCLFAAGLFVQAIQNSVQFPMIVNMLVVLLVGLVLRLFPAFVMGAYIIKSTTASECITAPVSYTHLDVYKRQGLHHN